MNCPAVSGVPTRRMDGRSGRNWLRPTRTQTRLYGGIFEDESAVLVVQLQTVGAVDLDLARGVNTEMVGTVISQFGRDLRLPDPWASDGNQLDVNNSVRMAVKILFFLRLEERNNSTYVYLIHQRAWEVTQIYIESTIKFWKIKLNLRLLNLNLKY